MYKMMMVRVLVEYFQYIISSYISILISIQILVISWCYHHHIQSKLYPHSKVPSFCESRGLTPQFGHRWSVYENQHKIRWFQVIIVICYRCWIAILSSFLDMFFPQMCFLPNLKTVKTIVIKRWRVSPWIEDESFHLKNLVGGLEHVLLFHRLK